MAQVAWDGGEGRRRGTVPQPVLPMTTSAVAGEDLGSPAGEAFAFADRQCGVPDRSSPCGPGDGAVAEHSLSPLFFRVAAGQWPRPGQARQPCVAAERLQVVHEVDRLPPGPRRRAVEQPRVAGA